MEEGQVVSARLLPSAVAEAVEAAAPNGKKAEEPAAAQA
jgi:hypothetical protein